MADEKKTAWANVKWPAKFVHPVQVEDKQGKVWDKAVCGLPSGVKINGVTLADGYACSIFLNDVAKKDIAENKPYVHVGFKGDQKVELFGTVRGTDEKLPKLEVSPFDLTHGIAENNKVFQEQLEARRAAAKETAEPEIDDAEDGNLPRVADRLNAAREQSAAIADARPAGGPARDEQVM